MICPVDQNDLRRGLPESFGGRQPSESCPDNNNPVSSHSLPLPFLGDGDLRRSGEVRWTFLEKRSDRFFGISRPDTHRELAVLHFRGFKKCVPPRLFHEPFRSLQRCGWFFRQLLCSFRSGFEELCVAHDTGDEAEFCAAVRIERETEQKEFGGT